jgi:hypothetical protein
MCGKAEVLMSKRKRLKLSTSPIHLSPLRDEEFEKKEFELLNKKKKFELSDAKMILRSKVDLQTILRFPPKGEKVFVDLRKIKSIASEGNDVFTVTLLFFLLYWILQTQIAKDDSLKHFLSGDVLNSSLLRSMNRRRNYWLFQDHTNINVFNIEFSNTNIFPTTLL